MKTLTDLAKQLRRNQTEVEKRLWYRLRARQIGGYKFRRQHQIGNFIADFVCPERMLIVEIDGGQHSEQVQRDSARTTALFSMGYRVLRFWNNEVVENIEAVLEVIRLALESPSPLPSPRRRGEGDEY